MTFADADLTDHENASVALTGSSTTSGAGNLGRAGDALADAMALPTTHFDSNTGTIDWSFALDDSLVQYLAKDETVTATYTITLPDDSGDSATDTHDADRHRHHHRHEDAPAIEAGNGTPALAEISTAPLYPMLGSISADGEFVAYTSTANPPPNNEGSAGSVYEYDGATGISTDVSALVQPADLHDGETFGSNLPSMSAGGAYVVFQGDYPFDAGTASDIYVYDRTSGL